MKIINPIKKLIEFINNIPRIEDTEGMFKEDPSDTTPQERKHLSEDEKK